MMFKRNKGDQFFLSPAISTELETYEPFSKKLNDNIQKPSIILL